MANSIATNVIRVDTTAAFANAIRIKSIKYIGASTGTAAITETVSGKTVWEDSGASNLYNAELDIHVPGGVTVTLANSAVVYLYLR